MRPMLWLTLLTAGASCIASADKTAPATGANRPLSNVAAGRPGHAFPPLPPRPRLLPPQPRPSKQHRSKKKPVARSHAKKSGRKPLRPSKPHPHPRALPAIHRREYAPAAPPAQALPQIIIKQAGPSKQFGWVGHGKHGTKALPSVMALANLPGWIPVGNSLFEAGLMYPGNPEKEPTVPYSAPASSISYNAPQPAPSKPTYTAPKPSEQPSYVAPEIAPAAPAPKPTKAPPKAGHDARPSGVYSSGNPFFTSGHHQAAPAQSSGAYSPQNPFSTTGQQTRHEAPAPAPPPPPPRETTPPHTTPTPVPVTTATTTKATTAATKQPTYFQPERPKIFSTHPNVFTAFKNPFPSYSASPSRPTAAPAPSQALNIPVNVEEEKPEGENGEVFYVFYEDDEKPSASSSSNRYKSPPPQNSVSAYVEEAPARPLPPRRPYDLFNPPDDEDIRTIHVPFENAVNVPNSFDVSVAASYGQSHAAKPQPDQPTYKSGFPNFPANTPAVSPTYDNPISSYDAPIYNDHSYTAKRPITDVLYREDAGRIRHQGKTRKSRQPQKSQGPAGSDSAAVRTPGAPYGTRLGPRKQYEILGL